MYFKKFHKISRKYYFLIECSNGQALQTVALVNACYNFNPFSTNGTFYTP